MTVDKVTGRTLRGTTNQNQRGSSYSRRSRRSWLIATYASDVPGFCRCYRCGVLLFNPDDRPAGAATCYVGLSPAFPLTVDRIVPGCQGGRYVRTNIRPACGPCNSETGGALARRGKA